MKETFCFDSVEIRVLPICGLESGITWLNCADRGLKLFEKQYPLSEGMTYNSYIIEDEKVAVIDTVDHAVERQWREVMARFFDEKGGRKPDYLVVQHLEPDHSAAIEAFMADFPECKLVCTAKAAGMLPQFVDGLAADRILQVKEGETLQLGKHTLQFALAPMVHWPEVMVTFDSLTGTLFSADAFGTFGTALAAQIAEGSEDYSRFEAEWTDEARRYFINICGKYGAPVQMLLKKAAKLDARFLCPLHGPVINAAAFNPVPLYNVWSSYAAQYPHDCCVFAASLHGNTIAAAEKLTALMNNAGVKTQMFDLSHTDLSEAVSRAFACGGAVFMSSTYDAGIVPAMSALLSRLKSKGWQQRVAGVVENGSWAPVAAKQIIKELEEMKEIAVASPTVTIRTRLNAESESALKDLAVEMATTLKKG
jgi:flavorubredoxin